MGVCSVCFANLWFLLELITNKRSGKPWRESKNFQFLSKKWAVNFFALNWWINSNTLWDFSFKTDAELESRDVKTFSWRSVPFSRPPKWHCSFEPMQFSFTLSLKGVTEAHLIPAFSVPWNPLTIFAPVLIVWNFRCRTENKTNLL